MEPRNTSNPMAQNAAFERAQVLDGEPMTISGAINKTLLLLTLAVLSGSYTWNLFLQGFTDKARIFMIGGAVAAFIMVIATSFNPKMSKPLAIAYALCEGLMLGGFSAMYNTGTQGIVFQAIVATFLTAFVMLFLYKTKILQATPTFIKVMTISVITIAIFYGITFIASIFNIGFLAPMLTVYNSVWFSVVVVVIAALCLITDFNFIEKGAQNYMPKVFEWYGAMTLMVTLVWLYVEILKLMSKLSKK